MSSKLFALWWMPSGETSAELSELIRNLAGEFDRVPFEPHVTIASSSLESGEEAHRRAEAVAREIHAARIETRGIATEDDYYRALYLPVKRTAALDQARRVAEDLFCRAALPPYQPHLSLLYGQLSEDQNRQAIERIGAGRVVKFTAPEMHLILAEGCSDKWKRIARWPTRPADPAASSC